MSNYQSGSSIRPSSQRYPKVSIGIMVEKTPKMGYAARKEEGTVLPVKEMAPSSQEKIVEEDRGAGTTPIFTEKEALGKERVSPWVSARSMYHETPNVQAIHFHAKASMLRSGDGLHEKLNSATYEKRREKIGNVESVEDTAKFGECRSEALRMKLWEALSPASSQNKHISSPPLVSENATILKSENHKDYQIHEVPKLRQDTDTIETDSENPNMTTRKASPNQTMRRPVTRSLARKKDPSKVPPKLQLQKHSARKHLTSSRSELKQKTEEKNIFTFDEGEKRMESSIFPANVHLPVSAPKEHEIKSERIEPRRISFPSRSVSRKSSHSNKSLQSNDKEQPLPSPEKETNRTSAVRDAQTIHYEPKDKNRQPSNSITEKIVHSADHHLENLSNSSLTNSSETHELDSPPLEREFQGSQRQTLSKDGHPHEEVNSPTPARRSKSLDHLYSPTLAVNITLSPPERKSMENGCHGPTFCEEQALPGSFKSRLNPRACSSDSVAHPESSDGIRDPQAFPTGESSPVVKGKATEKYFSPFQVQPQSSQSLETDEIVGKGFRKTGRWYTKSSGHNKSPFTLRDGRRICSLEDIEVGKLDPSSGFPFNFSGTGTAIGSRSFDQTPEDNLSRAITQLAAVLERLKAKIKLHTCKRGSEILLSVGDSIHLQLQEVESLIQADVEKFTSLCKSKRKRLKSTFLEQQEKLKAIREKFKEEVNQHLVDCRSTLEELEACQEELKGNVDRQKAAHRKLILQVQEAMVAQLAGAETSIAAVHKAARKRMEGLKYALREWLTDDGTFN